MTRKKRNMLAFAAALALLSECIAPSVNPLYTDEDLVFDPRLLGVWVEEGSTGSTRKIGPSKRAPVTPIS